MDLDLVVPELGSQPRLDLELRQEPGSAKRSGAGLGVCRQLEGNPQSKGTTIAGMTKRHPERHQPPLSLTNREESDAKMRSIPGTPGILNLEQPGNSRLEALVIVERLQ